MVSKIIKSSPLLLFVNHLVDWLEKIAPTRNYDSSRINFRESFGDNFSGFLNQRGVTDFNDPDIAFSTKANRLSKKQLSNLNSIFHQIFDRLKKGQVKDAQVFALDKQQCTMISAMMGGILPYHKILETQKESFIKEIDCLLDEDETVLLDCMRTTEYVNFITSKNIQNLDNFEDVILNETEVLKE